MKTNSRFTAIIDASNVAMSKVRDAAARGDAQLAAVRAEAEKLSVVRQLSAKLAAAGDPTPEMARALANAAHRASVLSSAVCRDLASLPIISGASFIAMSMADATAGYEAISVEPDPARVKEVDSGLEKFEALERSNPKSANILADMPLDGALHLLQNHFPAPAHRPKRLGSETEDQLRRMDEFIATGAARTCREAAEIVVPSSVMRSRKHRVDYLVKLRRKQKSGKK